MKCGSLWGVWGVGVWNEGVWGVGVYGVWECMSVEGLVILILPIMLSRYVMLFYVTLRRYFIRSANFLKNETF